MTTNTHPRSSAGNTLVNVLFIGFVLMIGYLLWPFVVAQYYGHAPTEQAPAAAPALIVPTPVRLPAPVYVQAPAPVIVQEVPAGQVPQPIQVQPAAPAPVQAENAPAVEPAPAPIIIVHQVSSDGAHQTITGSGACKVARVAARCSK